MSHNDLLTKLQDAKLLREHLGQLNHNELLVAQSAVRFVLEQLSVAALAIVPRKPSEGLLMSMAVRSDHALGCPGYYDQPLLGGKVGAHEARVQAALREMSKLHEEVVGEGFYRPEHDARYVAMLPLGVKAGNEGV